MSPRTRFVPLSGRAPLAGRAPLTGLAPLAGLLIVLLAGCGEPPQPAATSAPRPTDAPSVALPPPIVPSIPAPSPTLPGFPLDTGYPTLPAPPPILAAPTFAPPTTTPPPTTASPSPLPPQAPRCAAEPTGAQILALIEGRPGIPADPLRVSQGPFCAGTWSFATVVVDGRDATEVEPLNIVATGRAETLAAVAAGSDVCVDQVQTGAPPGIRVLACGF